MKFRSWFWHPFGFHFGGVLGAQMEAKAIKKPLQKNINKNDAQNEPQQVPNGGPKLEPKSSKVRSWKHLASRVVPKLPPHIIQDRFRKGFGSILVPCSSIFSNICFVIFACILLQHVANTMVQNHKELSRVCSRELPRNSFSHRVVLHRKVH